MLVNSALAAIPIAPTLNDHGFTVYIIENALPTAAQTHEVVKVPNSNIVLVSGQGPSRQDGP
ncbi:hypothetical protein BG006_004275, partial [Podila minutissima]